MKPGRMHPIVLELDDGVLAWLNAYSKGIGLAGSPEETAIYFIRTKLIEASQSKHLIEAMLPYLPPDIQKAFPSARPRNCSSSSV